MLPRDLVILAAAPDWLNHPLGHFVGGLFCLVFALFELMAGWAFVGPIVTLEERPVLFWTIVLLHLGLGVAFVVSAVMLLFR